MPRTACRWRPTRSTSCCCYPAGSVVFPPRWSGLSALDSRPRIFGKPVAFESDMATSWQALTLVKCVSTKPWLSYPGCDESGGCHDLTLGKIYECLGIEG